MKRILFVSHERNIFGSTNSMITLLKELEKEYGYEIKVLLPYYGLASDFFDKNGISYRVFYYFNDYRHIGKKKVLKECIKEFANNFAVWRLTLALKKKKYDYVISNSSAVDIGVRAAARANVKHLYYIREFMEEDFSFEYRNKERMRKMLEWSHKIIFISSAVADKYTQLYQIKDYRIIYNGIAPENYFLGSHEILKNDELRLIQIGSLNDGKGSKNSIILIKKLKETVKCHLTLVGSGSDTYIKEMYDYIRKNQLEQNVAIISYTSNIKALLESEDILLINSRSEGFGRVTVEGMLGGLLAVGRNAGGTKEIIKNGETGVLFQSEDEFLHVMNDINHNRLLYQEIARKGQAYALKNFSPKKNAERVESYLRESGNDH